MASEVFREKVYGNFRPSLAERNERRPSRARDRREGMSDRHLFLIRQLRCSVCERHQWIHAHHLVSGPALATRGLGLKTVDRWAAPLCGPHHEELHTLGSRRELQWFRDRGIYDVYELANALWNRTGDLAAMSRVLLAHHLQGSRALVSGERY